MRRALLATALVLIAPAQASAAGGGLFPTFGGSGATAANSSFTYIALPVPGKRSVIQAVDKAGGAVDRWRGLPGSYGVPLVASDGSTSGLSADGSTLVLVRNERYYPPRQTHLLVLDATTFKTRTSVTLRGFSGVDAVSP